MAIYWRLCVAYANLDNAAGGALTFAYEPINRAVKFNREVRAINLQNCPVGGDLFSHRHTEHMSPSYVDSNSIR